MGHCVRGSLDAMIGLTERQAAAAASLTDISHAVSLAHCHYDLYNYLLMTLKPTSVCSKQMTLNVPIIV